MAYISRTRTVMVLAFFFFESYPDIFFFVVN